MRAAVLADGGAFDVGTVDDPEPGAGQLLLKVSACGLCGSDLKARSFMPAGVIMGHEFGGEVVGVGPATQGWHPGMCAAVLPVESCGSCSACQAGDVIHCASAVLIGLGGSPGGFAEFVAGSRRVVLCRTQPGRPHARRARRALRRGTPYSRRRSASLPVTPSWWSAPGRSA